MSRGLSRPALERRPASVGEIFRSTLRGLYAPRRAVPIALVVAPLAIIQNVYSRRDTFAVPTALLLCATFLLAGPLSWRALFPERRVRNTRLRDLPDVLTRLALYGSIGLALVLGVGKILPHVLGVGRTFLTSTPSLAVCLALFWVGGWGLARDIELEEHLRFERARSEALEREADHAQLLALRTHLDPHFLFNTLNAIAEWCREDGAVAERAILELSQMLRTMMTGITETSWPLAKELELVFSLFELHAVRDPSLFAVTRELPAPLPEVTVPPMLLLPLAENAMKHGPLARHRGEIRVSVAAQDDGRIRIAIENPGRFQGRRPGGSGLDIVAKRLALTYGDRASFEIASRAPNDRGGEGTRATVVVPTSLPER